MSADFFSFAIPLGGAHVATLLEALRATEAEYNGNVYCDALHLVVDLVDASTPTVLSPNFPAFVALDRFTTPTGALLERHACRAFANELELDALEAVVARLRTGGSAAIAGASEQLDRGTNGPHDAAEALSAIERGLATARKNGAGLVLVGIRA